MLSPPLSSQKPHENDHSAPDLYIPRLKRASDIRNKAKVSQEERGEREAGLEKLSSSPFSFI
jgi:hypothetical protein